MVYNCHLAWQSYARRTESPSPAGVAALYPGVYSLRSGPGPEQASGHNLSQVEDSTQCAICFLPRSEVFTAERSWYSYNPLGLRGVLSKAIVLSSTSALFLRFSKGQPPW